MTYEEIVKEAQKLVSKADASAISEHLAVQYKEILVRQIYSKNL